MIRMPYVSTVRAGLLAVVAGALVALSAAAQTRASIEMSPADDGTLRLTLSEPAVGYIAAQVTGPPGATVDLGGQRPGGVHPITEVVLSASGTAQVPHLLTWLCRAGPRDVVASITGTEPMTATASIITPSCATRLRVAIPPASRAGGSASVQIRDTWDIGGAPLTLCVTAPGAGAACRHLRVPSGHRTATVAVPTPRIGGWIITAQTTGGNLHQRTVWATHPRDRVTLLAAGDSEMQVLDDDITGDLAPHGVQVSSDARLSTSLTNPMLFDWQKEAELKATHLGPDVTVIFMGANEGFGIPTAGGGTIECCSAAWATAYAGLVKEMARTLLRGNAGRVYWFLLPAPKPANFQRVFDVVNDGIRDAAGALAGRMALIDANAFFTPGNRYRDQMTYDGHGFTIHEPDGIHLDAASDQIAASMFVQQLIADRVIR